MTSLKSRPRCCDHNEEEEEEEVEAEVEEDSGEGCCASTKQLSTELEFEDRRFELENEDDGEDATSATV